MNNMKIYRFAFAKTIALTFLFAINLSEADSQIGLITGAIGSGMDKNQEKKLQASPAKDFIIKSNLAIKNVDDQHIKKSDAKTLIEYDEARFTKSYNAYDSLEYYKNEIKRLDPKWKVKDIETCQTTYAAKHKEFSGFYLKYLDGQKKCEEYKVYFSKVEKQLKSLVGKGNELYLYVTGQDESKFDLTEYRKIETEALELLKTHEIYARGNGGWSKPFIDGLKYLKITSEETYSYYSFLGFEYDYFKGRNGDGVKYKNELEESDFPGILKSLSNYENAYYRAKAALFLFPNEPVAQEIYKGVEVNYKKFDAYKGKIAISPFHKENMGKIFFSDHKITFGKETAADFKTEFKAGEPIFVIHYHTSAFYLKNSVNYTIYDKIDNKKHELASFNVFSYPDGVTADAKTMVYQYCLTPSQELKLPTKEYAQADRPLASLSGLKPGEHKIKVEFFDASAELKLTISESNNYKKSSEYAHDIFVNTTPVPKEGLSDASIHGWVVKAFANSNSTDLVGVQHLRTYVVSKEWDYDVNK